MAYAAYKAIVRERAERDIIEAFSYIAADAPDAALRWNSQIKAAVRSLSELPSRCPRAPESNSLRIDIRQLLFGKRSSVYRIVFRIDERAREVHVLFVRHGAGKPIQATDGDWVNAESMAF